MGAIAPPFEAVAARCGARRDAVTVLTIYLVVLLAIPSRLVVGPLGSVATPAMFVGLVALVLWASARLAPLSTSLRRQPVRIAAGCLVAAALVSYVAAFFRPIGGDEVHAADTTLLFLMSCIGVMLLIADGIPTVERLEVFLRRIVVGVSALAALGIFQFFTGIDIARYAHVPGLTSRGALTTVQDSYHLHRVAGTAIHPIEFGVVLAVVLPLALVQALHANAQDRNWACVRIGLIAVALPMSVSRSGLLAAAAGLLVLLVGWTWRQRANALMAAGSFIAVMQVAVPRLTGTLRHIFTNVNSDNSYQARTLHRAEAYHYVGQTPFFGRGIGTFLPNRYVLLDNQWLMTLIDTGLVGVVAFAGLFCVGFACGHRTALDAKAAGDRATADLGRALAGGALGAAVSFATFDALSFPMAAAMTFVIIGCAGAAWRLLRADATIPALA